MALLRSLTVQMGLDNAKYRNELDLTVNKTQSGFKKMSQSADQMKREMNKTERAMRGNLSNISYQAQDVAVQMQMGTDGFIIAAQQLPQALSGFGMGGAIAGGLVAITGLIMTLGEETQITADEIEEFAERFKEATAAEKALFTVKLADRAREQAKALAEARQELNIYNTDIANGRRTQEDIGVAFLEAQVAVEKLGKEYAETKDLQKQLTAGTIDSKNEIQQTVDAYDDLANALKTDIALIGMSEIEQEKYLAVMQLGSKATREQIDTIKDLIDQKHLLTEIEKSSSFAVQFGGQDTVDLGALKSYAEGQKEYLKLSEQLTASTETLEERYARESELLQENYTDYEHYIQMKMLLDQNYSKSLAQSEMQVQSILMDAQARNLATLQQGFSGLSQYAEEGSALAKGAFIAAQGVAMAQVMVSAEMAKWQAASTIPNVAAQAAVMASIDAQKYVSLALIGAQTGAGLAGMAHDGIDSVPKEGTWLLDKGERVVDSRTNSDLKQFLAGGGTGGGNVTVQVMGNIYGDKETKRIIQSAAQQGYAMVGQDFSSNGVLYKKARR